MSIRPLDLQVMVPRIQQVTEINHNEQQRYSLAQQQASQTILNKNKTEIRSVIEPRENEKSRNNFDAKDEGRNKYKKNYNNKNKIKKSNKSRNKLNTSNRIDIKI